MVLTGQVGRELVGLLNQHGPLAVGLSGEDAGLFGARRRAAVVDGEHVDLGLVGDVVTVNPGPRSSTSSTPGGSRWSRPSRPTSTTRRRSSTSTPTPPPSALAVALGAHKLVVLTDVEGVYASWPDPDSLVVARCRRRRRGAAAAASTPAWSPSWRPACRAVEGGVPQAHVIDGRQPHSLLLEVFTSEGIGTMVVPDDSELRPRPPAVTGARRRAPAAPLLERYDRRRCSASSARPSAVLVRGEGCYVWDADGTPLPRPARRHRGQRRSATRTRRSSRRSAPSWPRSVHVSNFFATAPQVALAERLLDLAGAPPGSAVFFANSGTEANEAAFKLARRTGRTAHPRRSRARSTAAPWARSR